MDCLESWYRTYERKTVFHRAIPNLMDGLKDVQRKVLFTSLKSLSNGKWMNTGSFSGMLKQHNYHHGDASRDGAIVNLTSDFKNQLPMLVGDGNFGNRLENAAAATRYTQVKMNPEYMKYLVMEEVLRWTPQDDNEIYEPDFYLFSIPMVLVNGISGIAVGLKTDILGYKISDVVKNLQLHLAGKPMVQMTPYFPMTSCTVTREGDKWVQKGVIEKINSTTLRITDIPSCYDRNGYISVLQKLKDRKAISDYEDNSTKKYDITVRLSRESMKTMEEKGLHDQLKLVSRLTECIKVLSPEGDRVIEFDSPEKLIEMYVSYMLGLCGEYINFKKKEYTDRIDKLEQKIKFLEYVSSIDIRKMTSVQISQHAVNVIGISKENCSDFMHISIAGMTKESINKIRKEIEESKKTKREYSEMNPLSCYTKMLGGEPV